MHLKRICTLGFYVIACVLFSTAARADTYLLALTPTAEQFLPVGGFIDVIATLTDLTLGGTPVPFLPGAIGVISGPDAGLLFSSTTNASGRFDLPLLNDGVAGVDTITASVLFPGLPGGIITGNNVVTVHFTSPVPEPGSLGLLLTAIAAVGLVAARKRLWRSSPTIEA